MKIAFLSIEYPPIVNGGLGIYCKKIVEYYKRTDNEIYIFTYNNGKLPVFEKEKNIFIYRFLAFPFFRYILKKRNRIMTLISTRLALVFYNLISFLKIVRLHREEKFSVVVVHDWMSCLSGIFSVIFLKLPVIFHIHSTKYTSTSWGKQYSTSSIITYLENTMARFAKKIIVPSVHMKNILVNKRWTESKINIILHGTDNEILRQAQNFKKADSIMHKQERIIHLLYVGRLVEEKGVNGLIDAMALVVKEKKSIRLKMLGKEESPVFKKLLIAQIKKNALEEYVSIEFRFFSREEVIRHYIHADICIFPSLYEPFGLVALEAMALGKPVILGDGFSRKIFGSEDRLTALFVVGDNPRSIASATLLLANNPDLAKKIALNAKLHVIPRFSWSRTCCDTLEIYKECML